LKINEINEIILNKSNYEEIDMFVAHPQARGTLRENLEDAVKHTLEDYNDGAVSQEPAITDRLLARIEESINQVTVPGMTFRAITFTDRGPNSEEKHFGADFAGFFVIDLPNRLERKFFLAQAKIGTVRDGRVNLGDLGKRDIERLIEQLSNMLKITKESYLAIYTTAMIEFVPALSILQTYNKVDGFWGRISVSVPRFCVPSFYSWNFGCYLGDRDSLRVMDFPVTDSNNLKRAMEVLRIRTGQLFVVNSPGNN
jgi:hypothetical protein